MNLQGLDDIEKRITPRPWKTTWGEDEYRNKKRIESPNSIVTGKYRLNPDDAQFIATARNVMPEMIALVKAVKGLKIPPGLWPDCEGFIHLQRTYDKFIDKLESEEA